VEKELFHARRTPPPAQPWRPESLINALTQRWHFSPRHIDNGLNRTDFGPDRWTLSVRGGATLVDTTFTQDPAGTQAYPGSFGASYPGLTGAAEHNTLGYSFGVGPADSVYRLTATFDHASSSVTLDFSGVNLQDIADESWGLDNLRVEAITLP
jgi:hypothetical protein